MITMSWLSGTAIVIIATGQATITGTGDPGRIAVTGITMANIVTIRAGTGTGDVT